MADTFHDGETLPEALATAIAEDPADDPGPPAVVLGGDETAYALVRALESHGVLTVVADADDGDIAWRSDAVEAAGAVADPADDPEAYREDLAALVDGTLSGELVAYPCSAAATRALLADVPEGVLTGYGDPEAALALLDAERLYDAADDADVPRPDAAVVAGAGEDGPLDRVDPAALGDRLGFPLECTAATGSWLSEAVGADPFVAADEDDLAAAVAAAEARDRRLVARERVEFVEDRAALTVAGAPDPDDDEDEIRDVLVDEEGNEIPFDQSEDLDEAVGQAGPAAEVVVEARRGGRHGDACVARTPELDADRRVVDPTKTLLAAAGFEGLAAARYGVTDDDRAVLLDATPHAPRWTRLVTDAGMNLPYVLHVAASQERGFPTDPATNCRWVSFADYLPYVAGGGADLLSDDEWLAYIGGRYYYGTTLTAAALHDSDTDVTYGLVRRELGLS